MCARATMLCTSPSVENALPVAKADFTPIKVGIVGCGRRTCYNVVPKTLAYDEYDLRAVCDIRPELCKRAVELAREQQKTDVNSYTDYREMFKSEQLDAVIFMLDPDKQIPMACEAMEHGLHVMVEVPLTYSIDDCWKLVTTVERTGKIFMLMEQLRYSGYIRAWRHLIDQGVIGRPLFVEGQYFHYLPGMHYMDDEGMFYSPQEGPNNPDAKLTWRGKYPPIVYLPHELSPMLYAINDRVVRVVGMSSREQSYKHPQLQYADMQAALMHTANDVIMRMAVNFGTPDDRTNSHWHHIKGTEGSVESPRSAKDTFKMYAEGWQLPNAIDMPWSSQRTNAPAEAINSGHGGLDYYVFAYFADAVLHGVKLDLDVYDAVNTAAPAILAAKSIAENNMPQDVPDFRPGPHRAAGEMPKS
ncbi:MAG: Gfo/Idh/MocA family oxidoreductase [Sedimentisphaerales bacterium]|nr:Gfo/Idh/MocA family oxidoreductase [Sedimentisphaerales bacterium]